MGRGKKKKSEGSGEPSTSGQQQGQQQQQRPQQQGQQQQQRPQQQGQQQQQRPQQQGQQQRPQQQGQQQRPQQQGQQQQQRPQQQGQQQQQRPQQERQQQQQEVPPQQSGQQESQKRGKRGKGGRQQQSQQEGPSQPQQTRPPSQQWGPQQQAAAPVQQPQHWGAQSPQRGPPAQQWGPQQQAAAPIQQPQHWGAQSPQRGPPTQQWGPQQQAAAPVQQPQHWGAQSPQRGPPAQQWGPQQQAAAPIQQPQHWGAQSPQRGPPAQQWGPQQQAAAPIQQPQHWGAQSPQRGPPTQQWGPQQHAPAPGQQPQQRGAPSQQTHQRGQQRGGPQQAPRQKQQFQPGPGGDVPPGFQPSSSSSSSTQSPVRGPGGDVPSHMRKPSTKSSTPDLPELISSLSLKSEPNWLKGTRQVIPGTKGRKIDLYSNHVPLNVGNLKEAIHYDVDIVPDKPKSLMRPVMEVFREKHYPKNFPAFDGRKNLYAPRLLPFGEYINDVITIDNENGKPKEFKVQVKYAAKVDLTPLKDMASSMTDRARAIQCVDIVLRSSPAKTCILAGRSFFSRPRQGQIIDLGNGMEMYYGFYQSAIRAWKPFLNIDVAHKAFPKAQSLLDLILELGTDYRNQMTPDQLNQPLRQFIIDKLDRYLKRLKIEYEIPRQAGTKRIYTVNGLGDSADRATFTNDKNQKQTVKSYYEDEKRVRLRYPHLPTVWVGALNRRILLPVEFCRVIEKQAVQRQMDDVQTSNMIKCAATSAPIRKNKIEESLRLANYNSDPTVKEFGFSVADQFERLEGRVLQPPELIYANNKSIPVRRGVWSGDKRFYKGAVINQWTIIVFDNYPGKVDRLADELFKRAGVNGIQMLNKARQPFQHMKTPNELLRFFKSNSDLNLIIVVIPNSGPNYGIVKKLAEIETGCLTQCIKKKTIDRGIQISTADNILLKINSKMNGTNHVLRTRPVVMNRPCMLMGADVTHPSPDAKNIPSIAAVTASHDASGYFGYNICWRLQPPKTEIIEDLENITLTFLKRFYEKNGGTRPEKIIMMRDGVSDGQFEQVQRFEINAIRKACKRLQSDGFEPAITFLVVQKRHHTRLFPANQQDSEDKNGNVPAGTCVDHTITNQKMQDFYLVSHASIKGVAKPTKYCTLWDENELSNDDIEQLVYYLCHMFARCNRSVSYPAPTYYAHLAAARAKVYIERERLDMSRLKEAQKKYEIMECIVKDKPMFFV